MLAWSWQGIWQKSDLIAVRSKSNYKYTVPKFMITKLVSKKRGAERQLTKDDDPDALGPEEAVSVNTSY